MSQYDFGTIDASTKSGIALASDLNSWRTALHSLHSGASRPSYAVAGTLWLDTTSSPWTIRIFDGSDDIAIGTVDATTNNFAVTLNDSVVTTAKINNGAVTVAKLATVAGNAGKLVAYNASGVPTVVAAGTNNYPLVSNGSSLAAFEQLATSGIADAAVTVAKISAAGSTAGQVLTSTGSGTAPSFQSLSTADNVVAWVNFNGTGTVAIRASENVSSITDHGVGDYTINFTSTLTDANYALAFGGQPVSPYTTLPPVGMIKYGTTPTTSSVRIQTVVILEQTVGEVTTYSATVDPLRATLSIIR